MRSLISLLVFGLLAVLARAAPHKRQDGGDRYVFAHFMMGIVANRASEAPYEADMKSAKAAGIDAFALNIGKDEYNQKQLGYAYQAAANTGMKVFISFDFAYWQAGDVQAIGDLIKQFAGHDGQLQVDGKPFVSTFIGSDIDVAAIEAIAGDIFFVPNYPAGSSTNGIDGAFNWGAWPNNNNNRAGDIPPSSGDEAYVKWLGDKRKYMAAVSPWFYVHYGQEVSYPKNWVFPSDDLWFNRWSEILELGPRFVEILTWNDYGESHYVGPLSSEHADDGNSKWVNDMPHSGWLEMSKPFIAAFKAGQKTPSASEDKLIYWYRPMPSTVDCGGTDNLPKPEGSNYMKDEVFLVASLKEAGSVIATSGSNEETFEAPAGVSLFKVKMGVGSQKFTLSRGSSEVMSETSERDILDTCPCGIFNYNAYVGTVPAGPKDALAASENISKGVKEGVTCEAKSTLPIRASGSPQIKLMKRGSNYTVSAPQAATLLQKVQEGLIQYSNVLAEAENMWRSMQLMDAPNRVLDEFFMDRNEDLGEAWAQWERVSTGFASMDQKNTQQEQNSRVLQQFGGI